MQRRAFLRQTAGWTGLAVLGPALAACGPIAQAPTREAAAPAIVRWPEGTGPLEIEFSDEFNKRFNAKYGPKITAVVEPFPEGGWQGRYEKWTTMAVSGTMPEIVFLCCTYIRPFMVKGLVQELDRFVKRDWKQAEIDDFYKGVWQGMQVEGKQMGIPVYVNMNIQYVNKNHLQQAGLPYPDENWDRNRFLDYVVRLHRPGGERWGYDAPFTALDRNISWIWSNGGEPHDPKDGPVVTRLTYDDPKTVEALQFLHDLIWKHQVAPISNDQRGGLGSEDAFLNGKIATMFSASGNAGNISTKAPGTGLDWDFLPLVKGPKGHGARMSMDGYMMDRLTKIADQAWVAMRELVSTETQEIRAAKRRLQPPRRSAAPAWERVYAGKNAKLARVMAETARPDPRAFWKDADQVGPIVSKYMTATVIRNELPVAEAMRRAMEEVRAYYAANK